jgi:hypothetical protein
MNDHRLYRGQEKQFDHCPFVPSALRGYLPRQRPLSGVSAQIETFLQNLGVDTAPHKKECETILKTEPFLGCDDGLPYVFWLSIVFCEYKISHAGKNMSFRGGGPIPFGIDMGFDSTANNCGLNLNIICAKTIEEYAIKMVQCYFEHTPPAKGDDFIRNYMDHQHYSKGSGDGDPCLKGSYDYVPYSKGYKSKDGSIVDGDDLPDHFTFLLDWTESKNVAARIAKPGGTVVSIDAEKYEYLVGADYKMSYNDKILQYRLIDTAKPQQSVVTFWPWIFTISDLETNEFGHALDFRRE